jgi:hypothetical protein
VTDARVRPAACSRGAAQGRRECVRRPQNRPPLAPPGGRRVSMPEMGPVLHAPEHMHRTRFWRSHTLATRTKSNATCHRPRSVQVDDVELCPSGTARHQHARGREGTCAGAARTVQAGLNGDDRGVRGSVAQPLGAKMGWRGSALRSARRSAICVSRSSAPEQPRLLASERAASALRCNVLSPRVALAVRRAPCAREHERERGPRRRLGQEAAGGRRRAPATARPRRRPRCGPLAILTWCTSGLDISTLPLQTRAPNLIKCKKCPLFARGCV